MCDLTIAGMALSAISTGVGMYAQHQQAKAQTSAAQASAQYNAQIAANEAEGQRQLAQNEIAKGAADRERLLRAGARKQGELRSQLGASGFEMDSGSALSLLGESAEEIQYDAEITSRNAAMNAWQHQAGIVKAQNAGTYASWEGEQAGKGSNLGMFGTLLGGLGSGLTMYDQYKRTIRPDYPSALYAANRAGAVGSRFFNKG